MKGDFTRSTFQPEKHYTSVRMQQGRLQLDSDWNEQVDIEAYLRHAQAVDMIGADSGVPTSEGDSAEPYRDSFKISVTPDGSDLAIAPGRLYVSGSLCELETGTHFKAKIKASNRVEVSSLIVDGHPLEQGQWLEYPTQGKEKQPQWLQIQTVTPNQRELTFTNVNLKDVIGAKTEEDFVGKEIELRRLLTYNTQPDYPNPNDEPTLTEGVYLAYIDVWQRHITALEDSTIREVALNIPDTTTRTKTVWQLKLKKLDNLEKITESDTQKKEWEDFFKKRKIESRQPYLNACAKYCPASGSSASTETGYRRLENQLYRVEIHDASPKATFKWSRDNGSIISAIKNIQGNTIIIRKTSQDAWTSSQTGQWIEITNEEMELKGKPGALAPLLRVSDTKIEFDTSRITNGEILSKATKVRRWEQIKEVAISNQFDQSGWVDLEAGIKVQFDKDSVYETGDYWLIPARSATNDIEWPNDQAKPTLQPLPQLPQGIEHDYCALALVKVNSQGKFEQDKPEQEESESKNIQDLRVIFPPLMRCLDTAGGVISGTLEVQSGLYVTRRYDNNEKRYITGKLGVGTKKPLARLHVESPTAISAKETISSKGNTVTGTGETFKRLGIGDAIIIRDSSNNIQTRIVTSPPSNFEGKSLEIDAPFDSDLEDVTFEYQPASDRTLDIVRLVDRDQTTQLLVNAEGKVGIGTSTPYNQLDVLGGVAIGQAYAGKTKAPDNGLLVDGTVSIGSTLPSDATNFKLYVNGNIKGNSITAKSGIFRSQEGTNLTFQTGDTTRISVASSSGNVGIGIGSDVDAKLNLGGSLKLTNDAQTAVVSLQINTTDSENWLQFTATNLTGYSFDQSLKAQQGVVTNRIENYNNQSLILQTNQQDRIAIAANGNVGIGLTNPAQQLLVVENGQVGIGYNQSDQSAMLAINGNVGIGITKPNAQLHVIGTVQVEAAQNAIALGLTQSNKSVNIGFQDSRLNFTAKDLEGYSFDWPITAQQGIVTNRIENYNNQSLILQTSNQDRIAIAPNGNISVGNTNTRNTTLRINGNVEVETESGVITLGLTRNNGSDFLSTLKLRNNSQSVNIGLQNNWFQFINENPGGFAFNQPLKAEQGVFTNLIDNSSNQNFVLRSNDQDRITITQDGQVDIGTPNSPIQLNINGTAKAKQLEGNSLKLNDFIIEQFTNNSNLSDNQQSIPTESAVKAYVDEAIAEVKETLATKAGRLQVNTEINNLRTNLQPSINGAIAGVQTTLANKVNRIELETQINDLRTDLETAINGAITGVQTTLASKAGRNGDPEIDFNAKSLKVATSIYARELASETVNSNRFLTQEAVSNGFYQVSSRALKDNINNLSSHEVATILRALNPVKFIYTEDESKTPHAGFIAEDTPDLLTVNDKQAIKVVDIVAVLTKVVQDHRKTLSDLVKVVRKQQTEIATLTQKVKELEERKER